MTLRDGSGEIIGTATTNNFGDFKFDDLQAGSGEYGLEVEYSGYQKREMKVVLGDSVNVGTILL